MFHLAGVLDDGPLGQLTWDRFAAVYRPKIVGAWNLHRLTRSLPLDWFRAVFILDDAGRFARSGKPLLG